MPRQELEVLQRGNEDIAVGVSGFGSASLPVNRWTPIGELTGRTTFTLVYEAQSLSMPSISVAFAIELQRKWMKARESAKDTSRYLAHWIRRWSEGEREILLVGFSLGAYVVWEAVREATKSGPRKNIDVILLQGAIADKPATWDATDRIRRLVNVYSREDAVLRRLYPLGVSSGETPAAGLGPLSVKRENVLEVDIGSLAGRDHLWGSQNLDRLIRTSLGCLWSRGTDACRAHAYDVMEVGGALTSQEYLRLLRWVVADTSLVAEVGRALRGDIAATSRLKRLDAWARESAERSETLRMAAMAKPTEAITGLLRAHRHLPS